MFMFLFPVFCFPPPPSFFPPVCLFFPRFLCPPLAAQPLAAVGTRQVPQAKLLELDGGRGNSFLDSRSFRRQIRPNNVSAGWTVPRGVWTGKGRQAGGGWFGLHLISSFFVSVFLVAAILGAGLGRREAHHFGFPYFDTHTQLGTNLCEPIQGVLVERSLLDVSCLSFAGERCLDSRIQQISK